MILSMELKAAVWLFLVAFSVHDAEEILTIAPWMRGRNLSASKVIGAAQRLLHPRKSVTGQFAIAVTFLALVIAAICTLATREPVTQVSLNIFAAAAAVMLLDGIKHLVQSAISQSYTPGAVTALLVEVPYALWILTLMLRLELVTWKAVGLGALAGLPAIAALVAGGFLLGRALAPPSSNPAR